MRALIAFLTCLSFFASCTKAAPPPHAENKLASYISQIDRRIAEIENERAAEGRKYNRQPRDFALEEATDAVFLRRAFLDTIGRIPTAEEARAFLADAAPDKRAKLIDHLLADPAWRDQRFKQLASLFRVQDEVLGVSQKPYIDWLRAAVENDMPFDELVRAVLTASGSLETNPATGYLLRDHGWTLSTVTDAAWTFLGVDLVCANCHDHPFADWTQSQVYRLAACFGSTKITIGPLASDDTARTPKRTASPLFPGAKKVGRSRAPSSHEPAPPASENELWPASGARQRALRDKKLDASAHLEITDVRGGSLVIPSDYKYIDAAPDQVVAPDVLPFKRSRIAQTKEQLFHTGRGDGRSLRTAFADWITNDEHFAQTFGLRAWLALFVEPHPQTGIEPAQRAIDSTSAERSSLANMLSSSGCGAGPTPERWKQTLPDNDLAMKEMGSLLGSIAREVKFNVREMQRILMNTQAYQRAAITLPMGETVLFRPAPLLRRLSADQVWDSLVALGGEAALNEGVAEEMRYTRDLPQSLPAAHSLHILGRGTREWAGDDVPAVSFSLTRWMMNGQPVERAANGSAATMKKLDELFFGILSRPPSPAERAAAEKHLAAAPDDLPSIAWALLNTGEFLFVQ